MRAVITGGGTGGHIYPAIAIADEIMKREPDSEILYVGNKIGLEKDIVPKAGYPMDFVSAMWIDRKNPFRMFRTGTANLRGISQASAIMRKFKPHVVVGTGGYVCFPVIFAGHRYGAPCFIHEQNAYPGVANRTLERYADRVFLGFPEAAEHFKEEKKLLVTGNPVRSQFFETDRAGARKALGIPEETFLVFSFGGSQGAEMINKSVYSFAESIRGRDDIHLVFCTGTQYYDEIMKNNRVSGLTESGNISIKPYIDDMANYIGASDLVICRCGALSVAEVCACGRGSIMIPSPNVTGNHQYFNARSVADKGGSVLIEEKDLDPKKLEETIMSLMLDKKTISRMEQVSRTCANDSTTGMIYDEIRRILDIRNGTK